MRSKVSSVLGLTEIVEEHKARMRLNNGGGSGPGWLFDTSQPPRLTIFVTNLLQYGQSFAREKVARESASISSRCYELRAAISNTYAHPIVKEKTK